LRCGGGAGSANAAIGRVGGSGVDTACGESGGAAVAAGFRRASACGCSAGGGGQAYSTVSSLMT
jgi:hypothetical protein